VFGPIELRKKKQRSIIWHDHCLTPTMNMCSLVAATQSSEPAAPGRGRRLHLHLASRLDLVTLKLFVAIVEEQSITRAAEREFIAPSAVSKRIADLEHATQTQLLHRHRKGVEPTPAGQSLLGHARIILRNLAQLESEIVDYADGVRGQVRLLASESALFGYFPEAVSSFAGRYPEIRIDLAAQTSQAVVQAVSDGVTDIGIFWGDLPTGSLQVEPCYSDRLVVVARHDSPLASMDTLRFSDVLAYDLVEQESGSAIQALLARQAAMLGLVPRTRMRVAGYDAVCRMVEAGMGIGIVPHNYAARLSPSMGVVGLTLHEDWTERQYKVCVRDLDNQLVATRLMFDHLTNHVGSMLA
jgi:DNA-binding transcriptional LysR family regulator